MLCLAIPAAYALSVKPVRKWTDVMFFFLSTKFLPAAAGLVPLFVIAKSIGGLNHLWFMIILYMAMNLPIAVWMMRSFLADIPPALFEAASLDGAGLIKTLLKVIAPIADLAKEFTPMSQLNSATRAEIGKAVPVPAHDRSSVTTGIVHFGVAASTAHTRRCIWIG